ncbi:MAG: CapA family protein [Clostridiales bacterium]|nr:CapA family protein [Clostridiales bacterium]
MKKALIIAIIIVISVIALNFSDIVDSSVAVPTEEIVLQNVATQTVAPTATPTPIITPTASPVPTPTIEPYTDIVIGGTGDIMCHIQQVEDASLAADGEGYSFYHWFEFIKPALEYPDLMIANLEGPIAGEEQEYNGYPMFNFPDEIIPAVKDAGIDVLLNGNNHIMDKKIPGIQRTIQMLDDADIAHTGAWESAEARAKPLVIDVKGIKVGVISATYSLNGFAKHIDPDVLEYLVCFIDEEQVKKQIDLCKEFGAEVIVVSPHMGDEFEVHTRRGIRAYGEAYIKMGADIVFGHHPHVLREVVNMEVTLDDGSTRSGIIFWSLGNFVASMYGVQKEAGLIAYVGIRRDNHTGDISITTVEYLPTWNYRHGRDGYAYHILPVGTCIDFPEYYEKTNPDQGAVYRLDAVWRSTTELLGDEVATPLRYVPEAKE